MQKLKGFLNKLFIRQYIKQNDKRLNKHMQQTGCFVRSCMHIAEIETGRVLTAEQIERIHSEAVRRNFVKDFTTVQDPAGIINITFKELGYKKLSSRQIGIFQNGKTDYWVNTEDQRNDYFIQKIRTNSSYGTHFRVVDFKGDVIFDPWNGGLKEKSIEYSTIYIIDEEK